ncbi:hypothetical protein Q9R08_04870 [Microbacterium sp. QXD-8]|uniref:Uncharacterized protein n=1 Tax=Microbacterium psychrotolerans TaxID=3068321 RepID=A0ABU0Z0E9_9MICO|nr:hypothetical protein [Microbacterium sp. QXD-8]MDQ7877304.1 hypothetical protein [Microbacterium sp. QXD-8]
MSTSAYRRCRREQLAWRIRHELRDYFTDPGTYRFGATVLAASTVLSSVWLAVIR